MRLTSVVVAGQILIISSGQTYSVATPDVTSIYSFDRGDVPLSNGQVVSIRVRADASIARLIATAIRVENSGVVVALPRVAAEVSAVDASLGVFTLTLSQAD